MKISVDLEEIKLIAGKADKLLLEKDTEVELAKLLDLQVKIEEAITNAQKLIEEKALLINPNFKSVEGDLVKASYRAYGQKYYLEEDKIDQLPVEMYVKEVTTKYKPNSEIIDIWSEKNGGLPYGVVAPVRTKSLKISLKKNIEE
jgi:hypothetical protein